MKLMVKGLNIIALFCFSSGTDAFVLNRSSSWSYNSRSLLKEITEDLQTLSKAELNNRQIALPVDNRVKSLFGIQFVTERTIPAKEIEAFEMQVRTEETKLSLLKRKMCYKFGLLQGLLGLTNQYLKPPQKLVEQFATVEMLCMGNLDSADFSFVSTVVLPAEPIQSTPVQIRLLSQSISDSQEFLKKDEDNNRATPSLLTNSKATAFDCRKREIQIRAEVNGQNIFKNKACNQIGIMHGLLAASSNEELLQILFYHDNRLSRLAAGCSEEDKYPANEFSAGDLDFAKIIYEQIKSLENPANRIQFILNPAKTPYFAP